MSEPLLSETKPYALILGGSKGLGLATAKKLARHGFGLIIVHRDRKTDLPVIEMDFEEILAYGNGLYSYNADATQPERRATLVSEICAQLPADARISVLIHSIAKGNLKPMGTDSTKSLELSDFQITINAMALSLYDWTRALISAGVFDKDVRILSFTSEGSSRSTSGYAAVSAAKAALEAITKSMALEFAPLGIRANCIQAGVTETASFARIPGSEKIKEYALRRNPNMRLTLPEDVANVAYLLCSPDAAWITGTVIKADGGESLR